MKSLHPSLFLLCLMVLLGNGCKRTACFTIENENYLNPRYPIQFRNCSEKADEFEWDFGDGTASTEADPVHTYWSPGTYEIKMAAINGKSRKVATQTISLDYASISSIKLLGMNPTKPNGDPWDSDGSAPDLRIAIRDFCFPIGSTFYHTPVYTDVVPPFDFPLSGRNLNFCASLQVYLLEYNDGAPDDTICFAYRLFEQLADAPIESVDCGSAQYEVYMSHN